MQLSSRCPSLRNLCTRVTKVPETLANVPDSIAQKISSDTILRLHSLTSLQLDGCTLDEAAIVHLSRLPSLNELSACLRDPIQLESLTPYMAPPAFAALESLTLQANELSILTSLLESMHFKPRSASFTALYSPTSEEIHLFFTAMVRACDPEQLSDIKLTVDSSDEWLSSNEREQVSLSTFQQLLTFPNVKSFVFDAMCNIFFDDDAIDMLTKHWPKLVHLSLNASSRWGIMSRVTHRGLITLLSRCVALSSFGLEVDFTEIDLPHSQIPIWRLGNGFTSHCRSAFFIESEIVHPTTIAAFLSDICPEMGVAACEWSIEEDDNVSVYGGRWEEVNFLLPAFSAVRRQCMEWHKQQQESSTSTSGDLV
ncbi:hypothetical protein JVU11DRAFT_5679 [Chiua virens]|nr:hypothetical protein JVU11DRAFT_5679 [Chiua virens]